MVECASQATLIGIHGQSSGSVQSSTSQFVRARCYPSREWGEHGHVEMDGTVLQLVNWPLNGAMASSTVLLAGSSSPLLSWPCRVSLQPKPDPVGPQRRHVEAGEVVIVVFCKLCKEKKRRGLCFPKAGFPIHSGGERGRVGSNATLHASP